MSIHGYDDADRLDPVDLDQLFSACVAAKEGRPGAGGGALDYFLKLHPEYGQHVGGETMLAKQRPADFWVHR